MVAKVAPGVRDTLKQLVTLNKTSLGQYILDLVSIAMSQQALTCPCAMALLDSAGLSIDNRARKICAGYCCSLCLHREDCMAGDSEVLFKPRPEHLDRMASRGWDVEVKYEEVTVLKPVCRVTRAAGYED